jgi:hypothetical protein
MNAENDANKRNPAKKRVKPGPTELMHSVAPARVRFFADIYALDEPFKAWLDGFCCPAECNLEER